MRSEAAEENCLDSNSHASIVHTLDLLFAEINVLSVGKILHATHYPFFLH